MSAPHAGTYEDQRAWALQPGSLMGVGKPASQIRSYYVTKHQVSWRSLRQQLFPKIVHAAL